MTVEQKLKNVRAKYISEGRLFQAEGLDRANGLRWGHVSVYTGIIGGDRAGLEES